MNRKLHNLGVGGSEVAAIFNADDLYHRSPFAVWWDKIGRYDYEWDYEDAPPDLRMLAGKLLEPAIVTALYPRITGRRSVYLDITSQHPSMPFMVFTPDGRCADERRGIESKLVGPQHARYYGYDQDGLPWTTLFQCRWYCAATEFPLWDVIALIGAEPRVITVERLDAAAERHMLEYVREWHARYIDGGEIPPLDTSDEAKLWLQKRFASYRAGDIPEADDKEAALLDQCAEARRERKWFETLVEEIEVCIKQAIGQREGLRWPNGRFTWRKTKDRQVVNWEAIAVGLMQAAFPDERERKQHVALHTNTKRGERRVHFTDYRDGEDDE
jgi:predicted phage-related endonuclease